MTNHSLMDSGYPVTVFMDNGDVVTVFMDNGDVVTCPRCIELIAEDRVIPFDYNDVYGIEDYPYRCPRCALVFNIGCKMRERDGFAGDDYFPVVYRKKGTAKELLCLPGDKTITMKEIETEYDTICFCHEWLAQHDGTTQWRCYSERVDYKAMTVSRVFGGASWAAAFTEEKRKRLIKARQMRHNE